LKRAALLLVLVCAPAVARAQISPGKLARAHATLEGNAHCLKCHDPKQGVADDRCRACHGALDEQIKAGRGLHARPEYRDCRLCHVEHHGKDFELVFWGDKGRAGFDHEQTGYALAGKHRTLECGACHQPKHQQTGALAKGGVSAARTFLGLPTRCGGCHEDRHRGQFPGRDCSACHGLDNWKKLVTVDHAIYPLLGRHATATCESCHKKVGDAPPLLKGTPRECVACHADVHQGRLGTACANCHTAAAWRGPATAAFDHEKTVYPLRGRHRSVACATCHRPGQGLRIKHARCADCHSDTHNGRLVGTCESCHSVDGWRGGTVAPTFDHDRTDYPLRGRHKATTCAACHPPGKGLKGAHARCADCHRDVHQGQFARRRDGGACESCHDVNGFVPAHYGPGEHAASRYPLQGAHLAVACDACHPKAPGPGGRPLAQLRRDSTRCADCHRDIHLGDVQTQVKAGGCESCHVVAAWKQQTVFDHSKTRFALEAGHAKPGCASCHGRVETGTPRERVRVVDVPLACESCHKDPHVGLLVPCLRCHSTTTFRPATAFNHDRDTRFVLGGAHVRVRCAACHRPELAANVRYKPLPLTCVGCHGGTP